MTVSSKFNRILLPRIPLFEDDSSLGKKGFRATGRLLPFLLEEFISRGVVEIVIEDSWRYERELSSLPPAFQNHVIVSKPRKKSSNVAIKLFEPFFEEFGLEANGHSVSHARDARSDQKKIVEAGIEAFFDLPVFLSALDLKAQVHFKLADIKRNLFVVKRHSRSPEMRANISLLLGIFSSYEFMRHDALIVHSNAPEELVRRFSDFTENLHFQRLSKEIHALGFFRTAIESIPKINKMVRRIFRQKGGKRILDFGSKAVTVATGVPLPDSKLAEVLLGERYLPPIVDLDPAISKAMRNFFKHGDTKGIVGVGAQAMKRRQARKAS